MHMLCVAHVARVRLRKVREYTQPGGHKEMTSILADQIDSDYIARIIKARNTATGYIRVIGLKLVTTKVL
jgi:hypothetical protein